MLKYPETLLLFIHDLLFPQEGFSSFESINSGNTTSIRDSSASVFIYNGKIEFVNKNL